MVNLGNFVKTHLNNKQEKVFIYQNCLSNLNFWLTYNLPILSHCYISTYLCILPDLRGTDQITTSKPCFINDGINDGNIFREVWGLARHQIHEDICPEEPLRNSSGFELSELLQSWVQWNNDSDSGMTSGISDWFSFMYFGLQHV